MVSGDIRVTDDDWVRDYPVSTATALLTPNSKVLILEEAWGWKFPTQCPPIRSAEDGQAVLGELLEGGHSQAQMVFLSVWVGHVVRRTDNPLSLFIRAITTRMEWQTYRRLETWSPDAVVDDDGMLPGDVDEAMAFVGTTFSQAVLRDGKLATALRPGAEVMAVASSHGNFWEPRKVSWPVPPYLMAELSGH